jgi:hypothetical protein
MRPKSSSLPSRRCSLEPGLPTLLATLCTVRVVLSILIQPIRLPVLPNHSSNTLIASLPAAISSSCVMFRISLRVRTAVAGFVTIREPGFRHPGNFGRTAAQRIVAHLRAQSPVADVSGVAHLSE